METKTPCKKIRRTINEIADGLTLAEKKRRLGVGKIKIGDKVKVVRQNFGSLYIGQEGTVTSIGNGVMPIRVTLNGGIREAGFAENELEVVRT